ncbi:MAG: S8 family serine peptidase [Atopobiaceae bacterium]|nr:S8 family serine peptidase [Atopobiaceae bacterium]
MKKAHSGRFAKVVSALLTLTLCLPSAPAYAEATAPLSALRRSGAEVDAQVSEMLAKGDYVEGEAVVCCLSGDGRGLTAQADSPLAGAERLSEVTARQYAEATGEVIPAAGEPGALTAHAEDEPVQILLVRSDTLGTEELLCELLADERVLCAEPNYLMGYADESDVLSVDDEAEEFEEELTAVDDVDVVDETQEELPEAASEAEVVAQADRVVNMDLTGYQWSSEGIEKATMQQHVVVPNPGMHSPHWNEQGVTNAAGVVAIMDSGIDHTHPDLMNVMYHFSSELQAQLGCGEYGFAPQREDKTDTRDSFGHGTHCAGVVAAEWNDFGVSGIANGAQLIAVNLSKSMTNESYTTDTVIQGYDFLIRAADAGVDIRAVNRSLGLSMACNADEAMIVAAGERGIITCMASGNNNIDDDKIYDDVSVKQPNPYIVRVNASDISDARVPFSNYGRYTTDLFAPGESILSTVPTYQDKFGRYFPEADSDPLYVKTDHFGDSPIDAQVKEPVVINSLSEGDIGFNGDNSSLKARVSTLTEAAVCFIVDIPVGNVGKDVVQDISVAMNTDKLGAGYDVSCFVMLDDGTFADSYEEGISGHCFTAAQYGWCLFSLHIDGPEKLERDLGHVVDSHGNTCIRFRFQVDLNDGARSAGEPVDVDLYLDQIAVGRRGNDGYLPYEFMSGTSMATPCVAGSAAVVSSTIEGVDTATRAARTVRMLKAAVRQADGYKGFCKQNGQIDLDLLDNEGPFVPVIESAQTKGETLVVDGAYFSSEGTLMVAGEEARILSWNDDSIVTAWPDGLTSGLIPLVVRSDDGAEACRAFIIEAPKTLVDEADLYERDLEPIDFKDEGVSPADCPQSLVVTEDGILFAAIEDDSDQRKRETVHHLARSDDEGASWTYEDLELPVELKNVSLAAGDGKVFIWGATPATDPTYVKELHLYSLDVASSTFEHHATFEANSEQLKVDRSTLAYASGRLFLVDLYKGSDDDGVPTHMRLRSFDDGYGSLGDDFLLDHEYTSGGMYNAPIVSMAGNHIYVCGAADENWSKEPIGRLAGLERVDVMDDGSLSSTDLSAAFSKLESGFSVDDIALAACDDGIFLVSSSLGAELLGDEVDTDTFFLKDGSQSFEPYARRLSYGPFTRPVAACSDEWLCAFATSKYEDVTVFGRATRIAEPGPEPEPRPEPQPAPKPDEPSDKVQPSKRALPKTGDPAVVAPQALAMLALAGVACVALGIRKRNSITR